MIAVTQWQLPLDGIDQAHSLHRILFETKFDDTPADAFLGSSHIAAVQHRLIDMLTDAEPNKRWEPWRQADQHPHRVDHVRCRIEQSTIWSTMPADARRQ